MGAGDLEIFITKSIPFTFHTHILSCFLPREICMGTGPPIYGCCMTAPAHLHPPKALMVVKAPGLLDLHSLSRSLTSVLVVI